MKKGILAEIAKSASFSDEHLATIKPVKPQSSQNACISIHDPPPIILCKATKEKDPNVFKRITSDGKQNWETINRIPELKQRNLKSETEESQK